MASTAALAEIWSLAFVSIDRFVSVKYPLDRHKRIRKPQVRLLQYQKLIYIYIYIIEITLLI